MLDSKLYVAIDTVQLTHCCAGQIAGTQATGKKIIEVVRSHSKVHG